MTYVKVNVKRSSDGAAVPQGKGTEVVVFDFDDILTWPNRDARKVKFDGDIVFKAGKYAIKLDVTGSLTSLPLTTEGDEDAVGANAIPEFQYPGDTLEFNEFVANNLNKRLGVAVKIGGCGSGTSYYKVYGTPCAPLTLNTEGTDNNEKTATMVRFQQFVKTAILPGFYYGTFTFDTATTVAADATTVDVTSGPGEYQLTDNTGVTVITDLVNATIDGVYTLLGSGGANPATIEASNTNFLLVSAVDWTAANGAKLTVKAHDAGGGDFVFVEVSRA